VSTVLTRTAFRLPVVWAHLYTLGLPAAEREGRVLKVKSDVYEQHAALELEQPGRGRAFVVLEVLFCLLASVYADLSWRFVRGHSLRIEAVKAGQHLFPASAVVPLGIATLVAATKLSTIHDLTGLDHLVTTVALVLGPLLTMVSLLLARATPVTAMVGVTSGCMLLAVATWATIVGPLASGVSGVAGLLFVMEHWQAARSGEDGLPELNLSRETREPEPLDGEEDFAMTNKLERWLSLGAIVWAVGVIMVFIAPGGQDAGKTDEEILNFYADVNATEAYLGVLGITLGGLGLLLFFGALYASLRRAERGSGFLSLLTVAGAVIFVGFFVLQTAFSNLVAISLSYQEEFKAAGVDPQIVRLFGNLAFLSINIAAMGGALAAGCSAIVALRSGQVLNRWFAWSGAAIAALLLVTFPLFGMPVLLFTIWVFLLGLWRLVRWPAATDEATALQAA